MPRTLTPQTCECGCGTQTKGGRFAQGHDARLRSRLLRLARKGNPEARRDLAEYGWPMYTRDEYRLGLRELHAAVSRIKEQPDSPEGDALLIAAMDAAGKLLLIDGVEEVEQKPKQVVEVHKPEITFEFPPDSVELVGILDPAVHRECRVGEDVYPTVMHAWYSGMQDDAGFRLACKNTKTIGWLKRKYDDPDVQHEGWNPLAVAISVVRSFASIHPDVRKALLGYRAGTEFYLDVDHPVYGKTGSNVFGVAYTVVCREMHTGADEWD